MPKVKNHVYTVRLEFETLVSAENDEQAKEIVSTHMRNFPAVGYENTSQKPIVAQENCTLYATKVSYLPPGWAMQCAPHDLISVETNDFNELDKEDSPKSLQTLSEEGSCDNLFDDYAVDGE